MGEDGDFGVWSLNKQVEHKKMCPEAMSLVASGSPRVFVVTIQPTVQRHCSQDSGTQPDRCDITRGAHCSLVTPSPCSWGLVGPAACQLQPPALATGSLGHDIPIHKVVTQSREETHGSGHDLNPRIPGSLRDRHRDGDHLQLWDSGDGVGGQWCVPGEPWLGQ